jgi:hypothetical protein
MAIESKNLLVAVKAYSRGNALPLDASEVWDSYEEALVYAKAANAYAGQTIKVLQNGVYETYVLQGEAGNYSLEKVGVDQSQMKQFVQVVTNLASITSPEQGVVYIVTGESKGYIYNGSDFVVVFEDVTSEEDGSLSEQLANLKAEFENYAALSGAEFTGSVKLAADPTQDLEAATKHYVDALVNGINSFTVGVVNSETQLPSEVKIGQTFRVTEAGTYAGQVCEVGDLIIVVADSENAQDSDFIVVNVNIDGSEFVIGPESAIDANIAVFDGLTGKKIKDSTVSLESLQDTIDKAHTHENKKQLDTYKLTQDELLSAVDDKITEERTKIDKVLETKIEADTNALENYYTSAAVDELLKPITENLNTKVTSTEVNTAIETALESYYTKSDADDRFQDADEVSAAITEALGDYATSSDVTSAISDRIGNLEDASTVVGYVNTKIKDIQTSGDTNYNAAVQYIDSRLGSDFSGDENADVTVTSYVTNAISTANSYTDTAVANAALVMNEF